MQEGHMLFQMHEELSNLLFRGRSREKQPYVHGTTKNRQELCQRFDYPCYWEVR